MSLPGGYFEELYAANPDPWGFTSRWYERRKYALTLAALPNERYRRGFEPGCSIGVLTAALAARCHDLVASDPCSAALVTAKSRVPEHVELVQGSVPGDWPDGTFDLVVLSELAYYLSNEDLEHLVVRVRASLDPDGHLVTVHWRLKVPDYPTDARSVHRRLAKAFRGLAHYEDEFVLLDVFGGPTARIAPPE